MVVKVKISIIIYDYDTFLFVKPRQRLSRKGDLKQTLSAINNETIRENMLLACLTREIGLRPSEVTSLVSFVRINKERILSY